MINHVRTLLMNQPSGRYKLDDPGEEYIHPEYSPKVLPAALQSFCDAIFGTKPDRLGRNYRMRQLMQLLHASELCSDVTAKDTRVTYLPFDATFLTNVFKTQVVTNDPACRCIISGQHVPIEAVGQLQLTWDVKLTYNGAVMATPLDAPSHVITVSDSLQPIPLYGSNLSARVYGINEDTRIRVTSTARPTDDVITAVLRAVHLAGPNGLSLIFPHVNHEPVTTWYKIWREHPDTVTRCAALLLSLAHFIDNL